MNRKWLASAGTLGAATLLFGAAVFTQGPTLSASTVAQATATTTGTTVAGTATITGTAVTTSTVVVTGTTTPAITTTPGLTATVVPVPTAVIGNNIYVPGGTGGFAFAHPAFQRTWERTDRVVAEKRIDRTWFWGPGPNSPGLLEQYSESPRGDRLRLVQYFDKSRMEVNNPGGDQTNPFFVTNGLLTVDLISGSVQVGENDFVRFRDACIPMTGDFGDTLAPTYFAFQNVSVSSGRQDTHPATSRVGQPITATIDRNGVVGTGGPALQNDPLIRVSVFISETRHNIPEAFWQFLNSRGPVYNNGRVVDEQLIQPWFFASGYPISEAYWTRATIQGQVKDVMIQAYERRALTYVPSNPAGFRVEMANIGQHYFDWRYRNFGYCPNQPGLTPTPPAPAPTGTVTSGTPGATRTATSGTPAATRTATAITTPAGTIVPGTVTAATTPATTVTTGATPVGTVVP